MAYKLIWSPAARDDLHDITVFIARDDSDRAMSDNPETPVNIHVHSVISLVTTRQSIGISNSQSPPSEPC